MITLRLRVSAILRAAGDNETIDIQVPNAVPVPDGWQLIPAVAETIPANPVEVPEEVE